MLYVNPLLSFRPSAQHQAPLDDKTKERVALEEFEHFFLFTLLQEMGKTVPKDGLFKGGAEREIYDEMLNDALSGAMAKSGQLGVAKLIEEQLRIAEAQLALKGKVTAQAEASVK
jgi:Rod binding domain-containing protein